MNKILAKQRMEEEVVAVIEPEVKLSVLAEALMDWRVWWLGVGAVYPRLCACVSRARQEVVENLRYPKDTL
jgi:hypothetical protein